MHTVHVAETTMDVEAFSLEPYSRWEDMYRAFLELVYLGYNFHRAIQWGQGVLDKGFLYQLRNRPFEFPLLLATFFAAFVWYVPLRDPWLMNVNLEAPQVPNIDSFLNIYWVYTKLAGLNLILSFLAILNRLGDVPVLGRAITTFREAASDMCCLACILVLLMLCMGTAAHICYGSDMDRWSDWTTSIMRMLPKTLEGGPNHDQLLRGGEMEGKLLWEMVSESIGILLLLNIFLTIIVDCYNVVLKREEAAFAWQKEHLTISAGLEVWWVFRRQVRNAMKCQRRPKAKVGFEWAANTSVATTNDPYFVTTEEMQDMLRKNESLKREAVKVYEEQTLGHLDTEYEDLIGWSLLRSEFPSPSLAAVLLMVAVGDYIDDLPDGNSKNLAREQFYGNLQRPVANTESKPP